MLFCSQNTFQNNGNGHKWLCCSNQENHREILHHTVRHHSFQVYLLLKKLLLKRLKPTKEKKCYTRTSFRLLLWSVFWCWACFRQSLTTMDSSLNFVNNCHILSVNFSNRILDWSSIPSHTWRSGNRMERFITGVSQGSVLRPIPYLL